MKDFFGNELKVGDTVAYMRLRYRDLTTGTVKSLRGSTQVLIEGGYRDIIQRADQVIKKVNEITNTL